MRSKSQNTGMGSYQEEKAHLARRKIYRILSDGQWHRNMELKEKTKLSPRTLAKHLIQMTKLQMIEKKTDAESGKYPVPVLYKAQPELVDYIKSSMLREEYSDNVEAMLKECNDPLWMLDDIHFFSQITFTNILKEIQEKKNITWDEILYLEEAFLWANYRHFTMALIAATAKIIRDIDIDQLWVTQAKRQKEISELLLKAYAENGNIKEIVKTRVQKDGNQ
jgi:DNA-binding HxlR family transcriptional regulator